MSAKTDYTELGTIRFWLVISAAAPTRPTSHTLHLYTASPADAAGGTEVVGGAYASQAVTWQDDGQVAGGGEQASNDGDVAFPQATANYPGPVVAFATKDHLGNILYYGPLLVSLTVLSGDQVRFLDGQCKIEER